MSEHGSENLGYEPRQKGLKRKKLFFEAATRAFVRNGFEGMLLKDIIAETGGSMTTLYQMFGNKEKLFQAVIADKFDAIYGSAYAFDLKGLSVEEALTRVGNGVMNIVTSDEAISLYRLMVVEAERLPHLRQNFMEMVLDRGKKALADYLSEQVATGRLAIADCRSASAAYFGMVRRDFIVRRLLGEDLHFDQAGRDAIVREAIGIFLHGSLPR